MCDPTDCPWAFPDKNIGVDCHFLLQRIFPITKPSTLLFSFMADPSVEFSPLTWSLWMNHQKMGQQTRLRLAWTVSACRTWTWVTYVGEWHGFPSKSVGHAIHIFHGTWKSRWIWMVKEAIGKRIIVVSREIIKSRGLWVCLSSAWHVCFHWCGEESWSNSLHSLPEMLLPVCHSWWRQNQSQGLQDLEPGLNLHLLNSRQNFYCWATREVTLCLLICQEIFRFSQGKDPGKQISKMDKATTLNTLS